MKHQFPSDPKSAPSQVRIQFIKRRMRQIADTGENVRSFVRGPQLRIYHLVLCWCSARQFL